MKFLIADESNIVSDHKFQFFVYGGIVVDESEVKSLSVDLLKLKESMGIPKERPIKWNNVNWQKKGMIDVDKFLSIKDAILEMVKKSKCKILVYLTFQDFYHENKIIDFLKTKKVINQGKKQQTHEWALNSILAIFNDFLIQVDDLGVVFVDEFCDDIKKHMIKHSFNIFPLGVKNNLTKIICPVLHINNEYCQLHQINDVVLGAITQSMREMSVNFLPTIKDNFWMKKEGDYSTIIDKGVNIYPKNIKSYVLRVKVAQLKDKFNRLIIK